MICSVCHADNRTTARFCYKCGAPLPPPADVAPGLSQKDAPVPGDADSASAPASAPPVPAKDNSFFGVLIRLAEKWLGPIATLVQTPLTIITLLGPSTGGGFLYKEVTPWLFVGRVPLTILLVAFSLTAFFWAVRGKRRSRIAWRFSAAGMSWLLIVAIWLIQPARHTLGVLDYQPTEGSQKVDCTGRFEEGPVGNCLGRALAETLKKKLNGSGWLVDAVLVTRTDGEGLAEAGRRFNVEMLVAGTYSVGTDNSLATTVRLFDVRRGEYFGTNLAAPSSEYSEHNIDTMQAKLAEDLARQIDTTSGFTQPARDGRSINCGTSYECYSSGRQYYLWSTESGYNHAIELYCAALGFSLDDKVSYGPVCKEGPPPHAAAGGGVPDATRAFPHAGLAEAYVLKSFPLFWAGRLQDAHRLQELAEADASLAVQYDGGAVETHRALAFVFIIKQLHRAARSSFEKIALLSPPQTDITVATPITPLLSGDAESLFMLAATTNDADTRGALYREAINITRDQPQPLIYNDYGVHLFTQGDLDGAEAAWNQALEVNPNAAYPHTSLAYLYLVRALLASAPGDTPGQVPGDAPTPVPTPGASAKDYLNRGRRHADAALQQYPEFASVLYIKAAILAQQGNLDDANLTARQALKLNPAAGTMRTFDYAYDNPKAYRMLVSAFKQAVKSQPAYLYHYVTLGNLYILQGHWESAIENYTKALRDTHMGIAYYNRGYAHFALGHYEAAVSDISVAIAETPKSNWADPHTILGWALVRQAESHQPALSPSFVDITSPPSSLGPAAWCTDVDLPDFVDPEKLYSDAEKAFRAALARDTYDAWAHSGLGNVLYVQAKFLDARQAPEAARQHRADALVELHRAASLLNEADSRSQTWAGLIYWREGRFDDAERELREAFEIDPASSDWAYDNYREFLRVRRPSYADALSEQRIRLYEQVVAEHPDSPQIHGNLAHIYVSSSLHPTTGDQSQSENLARMAEEEYNKALSIDPDAPFLHHWLGQYHLNISHDYAKARKEF
ncbi:MAG TPA: tetratricopeptide repeat protein, partial [Chloroflexia bacterium]|nr:tetratricopeptide repeat protein [Chloroflexia bacterium]